MTREDSTRLPAGKVDKCVVEMNAGFEDVDFRIKNDNTDDKSATPEYDGDVMKMIAEFEETEFRLKTKSNEEIQEGKEEADSMRESEDGCVVNINTIFEETEFKLEAKEAGKADNKAQESIIMTDKRIINTTSDEMRFMQENRDKKAAEEEEKGIIRESDIEVVMERGCEVVFGGDGGDGSEEGEGESEGSE